LQNGNSESGEEAFDLLVEWHDGRREVLHVDASQIRMTSGKKGYVVTDEDVIYPSDMCSITIL